MFTVEKIGGTSMSRFKQLLENVFFYGSYKNSPYNRIFVVSAYGGVTDALLEHKKTGQSGVYTDFESGKDYHKSLDNLLHQLKTINADFKSIGLQVEDADRFVEDRIQKTKSYLDSIGHVLSSGYVTRDEMLLAARELLASIGEAHSAYNSADILRGSGVNAVFVDLSGFYTSEIYTIDERIRNELEGIDFTRTITIVTGYTNGTEGIMREFDRGYSEITFSKICSFLNPDEAVIHKEYHLSSADPKIVGEDKIIPVGKTNFDVADQLADIGMEAIHPKASKPIEMLSIPLRIKNAFDPEHNGTVISKEYICDEARIEVVTGTDKVTAIEIHDPGMVGTVGFDLNILKLFAKYKISYILKTTNANSITHLIWENDLSEDFVKECRDQYELVTIDPCAVVCAIGSNIAKPGFMEKAVEVLSKNNININCMSQSLRQVNMQFVINKEDYIKAVKTLNEELIIKAVSLSK